jgi:hypothetical protein
MFTLAHNNINTAAARFNTRDKVQFEVIRVSAYVSTE